MTTHATIDLETLGITPDAVILTIGGIKFNPFDINSELHSEFYMRLDISDQENKFRKIDEKTLSWWSNQEIDVIDEAFSSKNRVPVGYMLQHLKTWFTGCDKVWAQGICFDISILEHIHRQYGYPIPWAFYQVEDSRTIINRMPENPRKYMKYKAHHALEDCLVQSKAIQIAFNHFGFKV